MFHLDIEDEDKDTVRGMLIKLRAEELSELRRFQTQYSAYGARRAGLEGDYVARIYLLDKLVTQMEEKDDSRGTRAGTRRTASRHEQAVEDL